MRVGIFFGGQSREREISFAGGRTVYDNLNKDLFEAVPIFVDSLGNFILLDWQYIYKGTIRDFYPPVSSIPSHFDSRFQVYIESFKDISREQQDFIMSQVGRKVTPEQFANLFDFAFLALHGPYGEDGNIQGLLEWYNIPYSGSGILPSAIGISKSVQKALLDKFDFKTTPSYFVQRNEWISSEDKQRFLNEAIAQVKLPLVIKAPNQGSSIGVSILSENDLSKFVSTVNRSFFIQEIKKAFWTSLNEAEQHGFISNFIDIRHGLGLPVTIEKEVIYEPGELIEFLNKHFAKGNETASVTALNVEDEIIIESFINGKEFSCIVIQDVDGKPLALPPTEIIKGSDVFDYRSKYLPGMARKLTPINAENHLIEKIRKECVRLYSALKFNVYARLDGFLTADGEVFLNDPNTTSGMLPSSFFFHQAAEIGLNPSQFLTYIIKTSLTERLKSGRNYFNVQRLSSQLEENIKSLHSATGEKMKVGIIMGGFSSERHISVESGRNIYEKISSSTNYIPVPIFLMGDESEHELYQIPINIMLKDNADDIKEKIYHSEKHPVLQEIIKEAGAITKLYTGKTISETKRISYQELSKLVDVVFIALHGRPGEDGAVQAELEKVNLPYNGSGIESSRITINKFDTNEILKDNGISVAKHRLVSKSAWIENQDAVTKAIEEEYNYPFIAKPADDGCSSAVKKIKNRSELVAFTNQIFREQKELLESESQVLKLKRNEDFPQKTVYLIEELISRKNAVHFLEVTGGLLTKKNEGGQIEYEIFEPSETLASGEVLSLEEKFLAGEGQNITPARFAKTSEQHQKISAQVRGTLKKVAQVLNIEGYARIDAFVRIFEDGTAETIIIEVNSLPGMTPATCIFHQTALNGYKPLDFIDAILRYGIQKTKERVASI